MLSLFDVVFMGWVMLFLFLIKKIKNKACLARSAAYFLRETEVIKNVYFLQLVLLSHIPFTAFPFAFVGPLNMEQQ